MKVEEMSKYHRFVWNILTLLEDGERIIGTDLQERAGIEDRRTLYKIINDLRRHGYLVGSSKTATVGGYYEIRDDVDLNRTLNDLRNAAYSLLKTAKKIELSYYNQRQGELFSYLEEDGDSDEEID